MSGEGDTLGGYFDDVEFSGGESSISPPDEPMSVDDPNAGGGQSLPLQTCDLDEEPPLKPITIRAGLYFDGTGNNKHNIYLERTQPGYSEDDSYHADYSNVARLEIASKDYPDADESIRIYVEGIGTTYGRGDNYLGQIAGEGATGIVRRVSDGKRELESQVRRIRARTGRQVQWLKVDAFGFSRGAAAARHFMHRSFFTRQPLELELQFEFEGLPDVRMEFVGIYDTVAALGAVTHEDDWAQLGLGAIDRAAYVVHLAAGEEFRKNFSLNPFYGSNGFEAYLPGAHSDVGGGYTQHGSEGMFIFMGDYYGSTSRAPDAAQEDCQWLKDMGWYKEDQLEIMASSNLLATRTRIRNGYTRIPLHLMAGYADEQGVPTHAHILARNGFKVHAHLAGIHAMLKGYCDGVQGGAASSADDWSENASRESKILRNAFLHMSSHFRIDSGEFPMRPYLVEDGARIARRSRRRIGPSGIEPGLPETGI